jgi:hypothetical protein
LSDLFTDISVSGDNLATNGVGMSAILDDSDCDDIDSSTRSDIQDYVDGYTSAANSISDMVGGLPDDILDAEDQLTNNGGVKIQQVLWSYWAIILGVALLLFINDCCRSKVFLGFSIVIAEVIVTALTILACVEMVVVTLLADFCMDPSANVLSLLPAGSMKDILKFYITCTGSSPFSTFADNSSAYAALINGTLSEITQQPGYSSSSLPNCVSMLQTQINSLFGLLDDLFTQLDCPSLFAVWDKAINSSLCTSGYDGFFVIWITHFVTAAAMFLVLITLSYFYEMYKDSDGTDSSIVMAECEPQNASPEANAAFEFMTGSDDIQALPAGNPPRPVQVGVEMTNIPKRVEEGNAENYGKVKKIEYIQ